MRTKKGDLHGLEVFLWSPQVSKMVSVSSDKRVGDVCDIGDTK